MGSRRKIVGGWKGRGEGWRVGMRADCVDEVHSSCWFAGWESTSLVSLCLAHKPYGHKQRLLFIKSLGLYDHGGPVIIIII